MFADEEVSNLGEFRKQPSCPEEPNLEIAGFRWRSSTDGKTSMQRIIVVMGIHSPTKAHWLPSNERKVGISQLEFFE